MAFVPQFQNDIFVSYAHVDDDPLPGAGKGWVTTFVSGLKIRIAQRIGRGDSFSLWMDHELLGSQSITQQIVDRVRSSATLIVVLSPGYVASSWCRRERETFFDFLRLQSNRRIFIVERDFVENSERPPDFNDFKGFRFWVRDREGKPPRILGSPTPNTNDIEYYSQIDDLSQEIVDSLRHLRANGQESQHAPLTLAEPQPAAFSQDCSTVFLAQVTDDLEHQRNGVKRFLDQNGIKILPDTWYSQDPVAFKRAVARDLAQSEYFVQLLSDLPGKKPPDLSEGYIKCQFDLANETGKPILQWRRDELIMESIEDLDHRTLLQTPFVRAEALEDFKQFVRDQVLNKPQKRESPGSLSTFVFVTVDAKDQAMAQQICEILDRYQIGYALPLDVKDPGEFRRDLEQNLAECDALVIIYGETTAAWVRAQIRECQKAVARRQRPLRSLAVFEGPPEAKANLGMNLPNMNMRIVNCREGLCENQVEHFLSAVAGDVQG